MAIVVQKYGGSSVATLERMQLVAERVIKKANEGNQVVVVVSAMGKTTNDLIAMAKKASLNPSRRELDTLMATGEQMSISLLAMILNEKGYEALSLTGFQAGIQTEGKATKNKILDIDIEKVKKHLDSDKLVVVAGFQGLNEDGDITTLGRGGSDTTAVALAAKLGCTCEIYTDVDGIYSVDPRVYSNALKLNQISYEEMKEMAHLGSKVMEPRSVEIGQRYNVPIYVALSTGEFPGTLIKEYDENMEKRSVTGVSIHDDVLMVTLSGVPYSPANIAYVFTHLAKEEVLVDMISQTSPVDGRVSLSFTATKEDLHTIFKIMNDFKNMFPNVDIHYDDALSKVSVVGMGMRTQTGVAAKIFEIFAENDIVFKQVSTSEISISYTISTPCVQKAVQVIMEVFHLTKDDE